MRPDAVTDLQRHAETPTRVSPVHVRILACALDLQGFDSRAVLRRCGVESLQDLHDDDWVSVSLFDQMMCEAAVETGDQGFGLIAGCSLALARYGQVAPLVLNMPSLKQGFVDIHRFGRLVLQRPEFHIDMQGEFCEVVAHPIGESSLGLRFRSEMIMCSLIQMLRFVGAPPADMQTLAFAYARPIYHARYGQAFGMPALFDQPQTSLSFHRRLLDARPAFHDRGAYLESLTRAELALAHLNAQRDIVTQLKDLLLKQGRHDMKMAEAANLLHTSERTLRRQLGEAGASYAQLHRDCLKLLAERRLADQRQSIKAIASELGFASVSAFHRAFKSWTGCTPNGWRAAQMGRIATPI